MKISRGARIMRLTAWQMTAKTISPVEPAIRDAFYPDAPPCDDMQNSFYLHDHSTIAALMLHFGNRDVTLAVSRALLGPSLSVLEDTRIPDLMVAFNCDRAQAIKDNGYCLANQPHAPQFVLEIALRGGGIVDFAEKRADYECYGVGEYWRFDPAAGDYLALAGDRLTDGRYQPISIDWFDARRGRGYSRALGLYVFWERERLLFYARPQGRYLRTLAERRMAEARADAEAERRHHAEARAAEAEARASVAEARLAELERRHENGGA